MKIILRLLSIILMLSGSEGFSMDQKPEEYRILILPGGGATGVNTLMVLAKLEEDTGKRIYELFSEIQAASIGSLIGALLTVPQKNSHLPMSAREILSFVEKEVFGGWLQPLRIRGIFREKLGVDVLMNETLIPLRILTSEVLEWGTCMVNKSCYTGFCSDDKLAVNLSDVVCSSCNVFAIWQCRENIRPLDENRCFIDAGLHGRMNPRYQFENSCAGKSVYFIGNGFCNDDDDDMSQALFQFAINFDLQPVFENWESETLLGRLVGMLNDSHHTNCNLAGAGLVSTERLKAAANKIFETQEYHAMLQRLRTTDCRTKPGG